MHNALESAYNKSSTKKRLSAKKAARKTVSTTGRGRVGNRTTGVGAKRRTVNPRRKRGLNKPMLGGRY